jgi:bisphosphoglycerate-independent phosphoglycerate mutase (AlkP superfamily)
MTSSSALNDSAASLRQIMSGKEGAGIDDAMYAYATQPTSAAATLVRDVGWKSALAAFHAHNVDDQFVPPVVAVHADAPHAPISVVRPGDVLVCFDYRTDRAKPLTAAFLNVPYGGQVGGLSTSAQRPSNVKLVTMTHYDDAFTADAANTTDVLSEAFNPAEPLVDTYAEVLGRAGVQQLVVAESEKWRAVTWFKDGRRNLGYVANTNADAASIVRTESHPSLPISVRIVESRKVSAHIEAPQMRAAEIADELIVGVNAGIPDIFANFANADMVGHAMTDAARFDDVVRALLALDEALERVVRAALNAGYVVFVTGDHGNAEQMFEGNTRKASPSHTTNKVPFVVLGLADDERAGLALRANDLTIADIGPAALALRGIVPPPAWDRPSPFVGGHIKPSVQRRVMRLVLDGYGVRDDAHGNAMIAAAQTRADNRPLCVERWLAGADQAVSARAEASGAACGYPAGEAGTTEFGHVLFDAGRSVFSDLMLIDKAIATGAFANNKALVAVAEAAAAPNGPTLHVMGILSDGKVHSSLEHLDAILALFARHKVPGDRVHIHAVTDGRDVAGDSSPRYIDWLAAAIARHGVGKLVSLFGRAWGKDRDNRWKRIEAAFRSLCEGTAAIHLIEPTL